MAHDIKKRSASHIYYGVHMVTGEIMHISQVPSGQKCNCVCAACGQPFEARKGTIRCHHFAHVSNYECMYSSEVAIYKALAAELEKTDCLTLPPVMLHFPARSKDELLQNVKTVRVDSVELKCEPLAYPPLLTIKAQGSCLRILLDFNHYYDSEDLASLATEAKNDGYSLLKYAMPKLDEDQEFTPDRIMTILKNYEKAEWVFSRLEQHWKEKYYAIAIEPEGHGSGYHYFGEPVYVYSLKDGIEDGFLAPFKVINITTDIGDGWRPRKGQLDIYGHEIPDRIYNNRDYDYNIIIEDRIVQVAKEITDYLKATDRMSKTIVFCATEDAALRMRNELARQNPDMMQKYPDYVVRITGNDTFGKDKLDYFISVGSKTPVIATTSKLLSTGADCKMTKLIVLDEWINSMTEFKQIIGRGTRIREKDGKTHFIVMDIRGVTALFADPDWDGPIEIDEDYGREKRGPCPPGPKPNPDPDPVDPPYPPEEKPIVDENGCRVRIINKTVSVYDTNGKLLRQESIVDYTKTNIIGTYASLDNFIRQWTSEEKKKKIQELLASKGIDLEALKADQHMSDVDDFDFICHVAFDKKPLTRKERANNVKKRDFLSKYSGVAREVLEALLDQYMNVGIYELEHEAILTTPQFAKFGKIQRIFKFFGGEDKYNEAVHELENELYEAG